MEDLHFEIEIEAPPEAVWAALTSPEGVAALFFNCRMETEWRPGSRYGYVGADGKGGEVTHVEGEILELRPNELLQLIHRAGKVYQVREKPFQSRLAYRIAKTASGSRLSVFQDHWEEGDPGYPHNQEGWPQFLSGVKSYVEGARASEAAGQTGP